VDGDLQISTSSSVPYGLLFSNQETTYNGEFNTIKNNLNTLIVAMKTSPRRQRKSPLAT
jgi:hypothetical protein